MRRLLLGPLLLASLAWAGFVERQAAIQGADALRTGALSEDVADAVPEGASGAVTTDPPGAFEEGGPPALLAPVVGLAAGPLGSAIRGTQSSTGSARGARPFALDGGPPPEPPAPPAEGAAPLRPDSGLGALRSAWTTGTPPPPHTQT